MAVYIKKYFLLTEFSTSLSVHGSIYTKMAFWSSGFSTSLSVDDKVNKFSGEKFGRWFCRVVALWRCHCM